MFAEALRSVSQKLHAEKKILRQFKVQLAQLGLARRLVRVIDTGCII